MICRFTTKSFIEVSPCAKKVIFITYWICNLMQKSPFLWSKKYFPKKALRMEEFQNNFFRPLFTIIFRTKILFSGPYSILTRHTKVESVAYVLGVNLMKVVWALPQWTEMGNLIHLLFGMKLCLHTVGLLRHQISQKKFLKG